MHAVKLIIRGSFWDSQLYSGNLLLFDMSGILHRLNWKSLVGQIADMNADIQTAIRVAFSESDLLYAQAGKVVIKDPAIKVIISDQLERLSNRTVEVSSRLYKAHVWTIGDVFDFLPIDTDVYYNRIIAADDHGLYSVEQYADFSKNRNAIKKHHDGRILQIKASRKNTAVAAAGGQDGLFEFSVNTQGSDFIKNKKNIASMPCSACEWALNSIFGWSDNDACLASFCDEKQKKSRTTNRVFEKTLDQEQILEKAALKSNGRPRIWGSHEKLYALTSKVLQVVDFRPASKIKQPDSDRVTAYKAKFTKVGEIFVDFNASQVIATGTALFGVVVELNDMLVVIKSDNSVERFDGAPVHWRIFPRSSRYSNQLHIIYDDHMVIVSFSHDYFIVQANKLAGFVKGGRDEGFLQEIDFI